MAISDARIAEIVAEVRAEQARMDAQRAAERAAGLRCTCCGLPMEASGVHGECADCRALETF